MNRNQLFLACTAAVALAVVTPAGAYPGGTTTTRTATLSTIGVSATASDNSVCSFIVIFGIDNWQCTPTVSISASAYHPLVNLGGTLSWNGSATCEYRKRSDGVNNNWTSWTSCGPYSKSASSSRSWGIGGTPGSGTLTLSWTRITNAETAFATDCVEIRVRVTSNATASDLVESVSTSAAFPSFGTNVDGICEGGSMY